MVFPKEALSVLHFSYSTSLNFPSLFLTLVDLSLLTISWSTLNLLSPTPISSSLTFKPPWINWQFLTPIIVSSSAAPNLLGCSLKGERARSSNHKTSLITVRLSLLLHLLNFLVLPLTLLLPSNLTIILSPISPVIASWKWILSSPQPMALLLLPSSVSTNPTPVRCLINGAPATCVASPHVQRIWEGVQTHFITRALSIPCFIHNDRKRQHAYLPPIHDRNLYLAKRWYRRAMLHNSGVHDYVDDQTHNKRTHTGSRNTPLELIRN